MHKLTKSNADKLQILLSRILQDDTQFECCTGRYNLKIIFQTVLRCLAIAVDCHTVAYLDTALPFVTYQIEIIHIHPRCCERGTEEPAGTTKIGELILLKLIVFALLFPLSAYISNPSLPHRRT